MIIIEKIIIYKTQKEIDFAIYVPIGNKALVKLKISKFLVLF